MKKLILSIIGVVGLTGISWGQQYTFNPITISAGSNSYTLGADIPNATSSFRVTNIGPGYLVLERSGTPSTGEGEWVVFYNSHVEVDINVNGIGVYEELTWNDPRLQQLFTPEAFEALRAAGRIPAGFEWENPNASVDVIVAQAQQLSQGLTFQDGQWTPAQP